MRSVSIANMLINQIVQISSQFNDLVFSFKLQLDLAAKYSALIVPTKQLLFQVSSFSLRLESVAVASTA